MKKSNSIFKRAFKRYFLDALSAMALGLFASLIIGLILSQISKIPGLEFIQAFSQTVSAKSPVVGSAIGVAIAYGLKASPLTMFSSAATGAFGYSLGGPVGAYVAAVFGTEIGELISGKTKIDIVLVPSITIIAGSLAGQFVGPGISAFMINFGSLINAATEIHRIPMGILVATLMGLALTAPISSAAIAISLNLTGVAAGAATVGCCAQMVGFAVASYRENKFSGILSQGLGTSMLQIANIFKNPRILIPPTLAGAILGPIATTVFELENIAIGAGMGTSGLVGPIGTFTAMEGTLPTSLLIAEIVLLEFIAPAILTLVISEYMRKKKWINYGDYKLENA